MSRLRERLAGGPCLLFDGGLGTLLMARGLRAGEIPELWNLTRADALTEIHRAYVEAGSDVVQTNTFGAHPLRLARAGLAGRCEEICAAAVAAARAANPEFVVGDLGPTGDYLAPVGRADPDSIRRGFSDQARALSLAGVDGLHIETQSDLREALLAVEGARSGAPNLPLLASLTFERKPRGFFTLMGDPLLASLVALADAGADVVGANCSIASGDMSVLATEALTTLRIRLVVQPNAGSPEVGRDGAASYAQEPGRFARDLAPLATQGAAALGGCCGTDPRFIEALRGVLGRPALPGRDT